MTNLVKLLNVAVCAVCACLWPAASYAGADNATKLAEPAAAATKSDTSAGSKASQETIPAAGVDEANFKRINESICGLPFSIAMPADFKVISRHKDIMNTSKKNIETVVYAAPSADGQPGTHLVLAVTDGFKGVSYDLLSPTQFADATLRKYPQMFSDYQQSASTTVELDGKKFGTATFEGRRAAFGPTLVHAFVYVGLLGDYTIAIEAYDLGSKGADLAAMHKVAQSIRFE